MSGDDVKRQVMEAGREVVGAPAVLDDPRLKYVEVQHGKDDIPSLAHALAALAPCTVLTPQEREKRDERVNRVFYIAEHLHQMIPREVWRANGAELEGHYEGDYRAEKIQTELAEHYSALLSPDEAGDECVCGEINARHCPVHQSGEQVEGFDWEGDLPHDPPLNEDSC